MLLSADHADRREPARVARCCGGANVVRVGPAEGQQQLMVLFLRRREVVPQLAPLVTGNRRMIRSSLFRYSVVPSPGRLSPFKASTGDGSWGAQDADDFTSTVTSLDSTAAERRVGTGGDPSSGRTRLVA